MDAMREMYGFIRNKKKWTVVQKWKLYLVQLLLFSHPDKETYWNIYPK